MLRNSIHYLLDYFFWILPHPPPNDDDDDDDEEEEEEGEEGGGEEEEGEEEVGGEEEEELCSGHILLIRCAFMRPAPLTSFQLYLDYNLPEVSDRSEF